MLMAIFEAFIMGLVIGWFGHSFRSWKRKHWEGSWQQKTWRLFWR